MPEETLDLLTAFSVRQAVSIPLMDSESDVEDEIGQYLSVYGNPHVKFGMPPPPPIEMLGRVVRDTLDPAEPADIPDEIRKKYRRVYVSRPDPPDGFRAWGRRFIAELLNDIREIICGKGKKPSGLGEHSRAVLTALAAIIVRKLGVSDPAALGIAVLVFMSLGKATKSALCSMTSPAELEKYF